MSKLPTSVMGLSLLGQDFFVTLNLELGSLGFVKYKKADMYLEED